MIPYNRQHLFPKDIKEVVKVLKSKYLTQGPQIEKFEKKLSKKTKSKYAVVANSATSALHLACLAIGLKKNDYLWTVPITFIASANCGIYCGAKIDLVDINKDTFNIDVKALEQKLQQAKKKNKLPKILIPVHLGGNPCDLEKINSLAKKYKFKVIEDASHAFGSRYKNSIIGDCRYSDAVVFSFHPVKPITSGEGGAVMSNNYKIYKKIKMLREHGIVREKNLFKNKKQIKPWYFEQQYLGFNYRLSDINAALGSSQVDHLNKFLKKRNNIAEIYYKNLTDKIEFQKKHPNTVSARHLFIIKVQKKIHEDFFNFLRSKGIFVQLHYIPIYRHPYYKKKFKFDIKKFPNSENYYSTAFSIPIYFSLDKKKQLKIVNLINSFFKK
jgi:UDP-4-amino-4,6-dideoxy-N-acetyl-beta-L-altrosamine transaminase